MSAPGAAEAPLFEVQDLHASTDDGVEIESCFAGEQEAYPGQHANRQTAVNEAMAATALPRAA